MSRDDRAPLAQPQTWLALFAFVGIALIGVGTWQISSTCYRPAQRSIVTCRNFSDVEEKWATFTFVVFLVGVSTTFLSVVRTYQRQCGGQTTADLASVTFCIITSSLATAYASYVDHHLKTVPRHENTVSPACIVCPAAGETLYYFVIWVGVVTLWIGVCVGIASSCSRAASGIPHNDLAEKLTVPNDSDEDSSA